MSSFPKNTKCSIIAGGMKYRNAPAAIDWLCRALGFEKHLVVPGPNDTIMHAQLTFGNGMIMLGSGNETEYGRLVKRPQDTGGPTQGVYLVVNDADAVYASAKAAGAEIVIDIKNEDYGGRDFTCRDPEGYIWSIGTYDPWAEH